LKRLTKACAPHTMQLYIFGLALMVWPSMSHVTLSSWEEEMEEALNNLDIELDKVEQRRILQEDAQEVRELAEEDYSKYDLSIAASDDISDSMADKLWEAEEKSQDVFVHRRMIRGENTNNNGNIQNDNDNDSEDEHDNDEDVEYKPKLPEECESFQITFNGDEDIHFHTPDGCIGYEINHNDTTCDTDEGVYPNTCTFHQHLNNTIELDEVLRRLSSVASDTNSDSMTDKLLKAEEKNQDIFSHRRLKHGRYTKQQQWVSTAAKKQSEGESEGSCTPRYERRATRGIDCDLCWKWLVPYPCNCNCRGWTQVVIGCFKPCSLYNNAYTQGIDFYCYKPCDREGQISLNVGCGIGSLDRTCVKSGGDCIMKYVNHAISILDVLTNILSGGLAVAFKDAAIKAAKAVTKSAAKKVLKEILKKSGKAFAKELMASKAIQRKMMKYEKKFKKDFNPTVMEQGSELFIAASMNTDPDIGGMMNEIAEALDPTGIYSLVKDFTPPEWCDELVFMSEDIPDEEINLPDIDALDLVDDSLDLVDDSLDLDDDKTNDICAECKSHGSNRDPDAGESLHFGDTIYLQSSYYGHRWLTGARDRGNNNVYTRDHAATSKERNVGKAYEWIVRRDQGNGKRSEKEARYPVRYGDKIYLQPNSIDNKLLKGDDEGNVYTKKKVSSNIHSYEWYVRSTVEGSTDLHSGTRIKYGDKIFLQINSHDNMWLRGARDTDGNKVSTNDPLGTEYETTIAHRSYQWIVRSTWGTGVPIGGGLDLVNQICNGHCSKDGYCGTSIEYEDGGTDCNKKKKN